VSQRRVLIVCIGNSARSQIAEGLIRHETGERFECRLPAQMLAGRHHRFPSLALRRFQRSAPLGESIRMRKHDYLLGAAD